MRTLTINKNDSNIRLDKFLGKYFPTMPKSLMYKYIRLKCIKINGKKVVETQNLNENDVLTFFISDEFFGAKKENQFMSVKPNVNVVFEDSNIIIVNKPSGMIVHSDDKEEFNTLINHVKAYLYQKKEYNPESENSFSPALCNRIDRNTEGLIIAAKTAEALRILNDKIKNHEIEKKYLCVVHGIPKSNEETLTDYIEKISDENRVILSKHKNASNKIAVLKYKNIQTNPVKKLTLLEVTLITGRTHQIRAQLANIGHPLLGDGKYAENKEDRKAGFVSQALSAYTLTFKFNPPATSLEYLNGRIFNASKPDFLKLF
ncbi:MAG: hypothetical protein A2Y17_12830 [Clostridiales bacterium GWF2_38_85]|nr:MAG: hypothetical protein A2Y17_12830 [Clostridiales bacterium GWF2_38_85]HBL84144.1 RluA family pseudouridine synthase [Clostridiales bacterium]